MEKLMNIKCYYDLSFTGRYNEVESWTGQVVLDEDGWFIGTVKDNYSVSRTDRIVCGIYLPNRGIQLYKFSSSDIGCPLVFLGSKNEGLYTGEFDVADINVSQKCGVFKLDVKEMELDPSLVSQVKAKTIHIIDEVLDGDIYDFYSNAYDLRYEIKDALISKLDTKDSRDLDLVNHNIFKHNESKNKIISKRYRMNIFDDDEDDDYFD